MSLPHAAADRDPCPCCGRDHATMPDDPSRPTDPSWKELEQQLGQAGLSWDDLGRDWLPTREAEAAWAELSGGWGLAPTPEDLDLTPAFLRGVRAEVEAARERGGAR